MFRVFVGWRSCGSHGAVLFRLVVQLFSLGGGLPQVLLLLLHVCVVTAAARGGDLTVALRAVTLSLNEFLKVVGYSNGFSSPSPVLSADAAFLDFRVC